MLPTKHKSILSSRKTKTIQLYLVHVKHANIMTVSSLAIAMSCSEGLDSRQMKSLIHEKLNEPFAECNTPNDAIRNYWRPVEGHSKQIGVSRSPQTAAHYLGFHQLVK